MTDLVLRGGEIIDGRGGLRYAADVVVRGDRIHRILTPQSPWSGEELEVDGLVIAPGFIDMHAHSDLAVLADPRHIAKVAQGVTLEVVGQDGLGYAPVSDSSSAAMRAKIAGWNGTPDLDYSWRGVGDYLDRIDSGAPVNVATLVPHGTVRMTVMGDDSRAATPEELDSIREIVADGLREGAMGMSTGLTYTPGLYASDDELVDALGAVREIGGYYCSHHRNYGAQVMQAYLDCIAVARRAAVPLHLAHCLISFPENRGRAAEVLGAIDEALEDGLDISLDSYPYLGAATYLAAWLPSWAQSQGPAATIALLEDEDARRRIIHEMEVTGSDGHHGLPVDWDTVSVASTTDPANSWAVGKTVTQLAGERQTTTGEVVLDLLAADRLGVGIVAMSGIEENVRAVMRHRVHTVGTDGILVGERPHPRGWGTFPRLLGTYVRDLGLMSLEEGVAHATSRPARRLGLADRGVVAEGFVADLAIFDPDRIASEASYEEPRTAPVGISHVFVNGVATLRHGARTDALPGRSVRSAFA